MSQINDYEHFKVIVRSVTLGFGMRLETEEVQSFSFQDPNALATRGYFLSVVGEGEDNDGSGEHLRWRGRKWYVSKWATVSEVVMTALKAYLTALEHEARETFTYAGNRIFDPHMNVAVLATICEAAGSRLQDRREDARAL